MANATATFTIDPKALNAVENTQKSVWVRGTVAISAATDSYVTGGILVTFSPIEGLHSQLVPTYVRVWSQPAVGSPNTFLYLYTYNPGSTLALGKMQIWLGLGASAEYTVAALTNPGADTIVFEGLFVRI